MFFIEAGILKYGLPQDSIFELHLFLLYVNYLPQYLPEVSSCLLADGPCIF